MVNIQLNKQRIRAIPQNVNQFSKQKIRINMWEKVNFVDVHVGLGFP